MKYSVSRYSVCDNTMNMAIEEECKRTASKEVEQLCKKKSGPCLRMLQVNSDISKILNYLYLGSDEVSIDLDALSDHGIGHIINCTADRPNYFETAGVKYLQVKVNDSRNDDIQQYFEPASRFIESAKQSGSSVLVHCQKGMSRSSTIVLAYLMRFANMNLITAFSHTKKIRPLISPNVGFMDQLLKLEYNLYGKNSLDIAQYTKDRFAKVADITATTSTSLPSSS